MHHQLVVHEVEAVRTSFEWVFYHELDGVWVQFWELVDVFACILTVGNTEAKIKVKSLEMSIPEEVTFNHPEVIDRFGSYIKLHRGSHSLQLQELEERGLTGNNWREANF